MLNYTEKQALRNKILGHKALFELMKGDREVDPVACLRSALELEEQYRGGIFYWVGELSKLNLEFGLFHMYFVPPQARIDSNALNQSDTGFESYPPLTVKEVNFVGKIREKEIVRYIINPSKRLYD